jgi:hypothetical protein
MLIPFAKKEIFKRSWFLLIAWLPMSCTAPHAQEFAIMDPATGIRLQRVEQDSSPALRIVLPGQPASDPGILVLFPEHVTAREHGKTDSVHLYLSQSGPPSGRPAWRRNGQSLEYEMELTGGVRMTARATLESDGVRYHYDFINSSKVDFDTIQAVTDPRMQSPYFRDVRLERTYVHHKDGFDLLASETPARLTMPLNDWLPNRYRVSYSWPVEPLHVEKKEDGLTWYNKSRQVDEPFLATKSTDGKWIVATFSRDPGNVWSNPELTCQHADPETPLKAGAKASLELKTLLFQGTLDEVLAKVRQQRDAMPRAPKP